MFSIIVFWLGSDKHVRLLFVLLSSQRDQSRDVTPRLGEDGWFFIFDCSRPFCFLLIEFHYVIFISYIVLTGYVYYYCILLMFNKPFSCFFAGFLLFSPKGSCSHGMWLLAWEFLLFSSALPLAYASSFRLLLLRLCSNRCAEALVIYTNFILNRLTAV